MRLDHLALVSLLLFLAPGCSWLRPVTDPLGNFLVAREPGSDYQKNSRLAIEPVPAAECEALRQKTAVPLVPGATDILKAFLEVEEKRYTHTYDQPFRNESGDELRGGFRVLRSVDVCTGWGDCPQETALDLAFCPTPQAGADRIRWEMLQGTLQRSYVKVVGVPWTTSGAEWYRQFWAVPGWFVSGVLLPFRWAADTLGSEGDGRGVKLTLELHIDAFRDDEVAPLARQMLEMQFEKIGDTLTAKDVEETPLDFSRASRPRKDDHLRVYVRITEKNAFGSGVFSVFEEIL